MTYTISNTGTSPLEWRATANTNWVIISPSTGSILPMKSINVEVGISSSLANLLTPGVYAASVTFRNVQTGAGTCGRNITLVVSPTSSAAAVANPVLSVYPTTSMIFTGKQGGPFVMDNSIATTSSAFS